ncbi:MAG TPA: NADH-quinone oxidoreductase subunit J [Terriglobales bacterium]|nr:NADH-quinone oxidoreductase subunit J [Terriglobales bacterium]
MVHQILFFIFAAICVAAAVNLLLQKHPIHSALSLIVVMGSLAVLYLLLGAEFVAAIQVIVYAGAIMVLFVFVIMLLNAGEEEKTQGSKIALFFGAPSVAVLIFMVVYVITQRIPTGPGIELGKFVGTTRDVALRLFTDYLLPFEVTSVLILIAIMGAVVLTRREN